MLPLTREAMLSAAIHMAATFHNDQQDKAGQPYILHPIRVMLAGRTLEEQIVGVLHDVIEDTAARPEWIEEQFGPPIAAAVLSVSRAWVDPVGNGRVFKFNDIPFPSPYWPKETYRTFIDRAKRNPIGRAVKINDILDNLTPERTAALGDSEREGLQRRYMQALAYLRDETSY